MKTFRVQWVEVIKNQCYANIDADTKEDAIAKARSGEHYPDTTISCDLIDDSDYSAEELRDE